jgi:DNA replication protein DnaC
LPENQIHQEFTPELLPNLEANYEAWESEKQSSEKKGEEFFQLLIMDDVTAQLKNKDIEQDFKKLISNRRHMRLSIILLVQFLRAIPKPIRFMVTNLIFSSLHLSKM